MAPFISSAISTALLAASSSSSQNDSGTISGLYRHAVKGLSGDSLDYVHFADPKDTFPDDRRFALLYEKKLPKWNPASPEWLHKENFLCAFTNPQLFSKFESSYRIQQEGFTAIEEELYELSYGLPLDDRIVEGISTEATTSITRSLVLKERATGNVVWGPTDINTEQGRQMLGEFFSKESGLDVVCVTAGESHQFGNTSSGVKQRKDTRTVHIINAATVRDISEKLKVPISCTRFRPNIVVDGWKPWSEFDWIGNTLQVGGSDGVKLSFLSKTVRCDGVSVDPLDPDRILDIPSLLVEHFPEHGPYLGVYAVVEKPGSMCIGDQIYNIN